MHSKSSVLRVLRGTLLGCACLSLSLAAFVPALAGTAPCGGAGSGATTTTLVDPGGLSAAQTFKPGKCNPKILTRCRSSSCSKVATITGNASGKIKISFMGNEIEINLGAGITVYISSKFHAKTDQYRQCQSLGPGCTTECKQVSYKCGEYKAHWGEPNGTDCGGAVIDRLGTQPGHTVGCAIVAPGT